MKSEVVKLELTKSMLNLMFGTEHLGEVTDYKLFPYLVDRGFDVSKPIMKLVVIGNQGYEADFVILQEVEEAADIAVVALSEFAKYPDTFTKEAVDALLNKYKTVSKKKCMTGREWL